ncbi:MAG: hypothetical protein ACKPGT_07905, partial [Microcystis sp.]
QLAGSKSEASRELFLSAFSELPSRVGKFNRPIHNIISRPKVSLVKESTRIKIILIASYFFSEIELATIDIHFSYRTT